MTNFRKTMASMMGVAALFAAAASATTANAQTVTGGVVSITNSTVHGNIGAVGLNGTEAVEGAIGMNNVVNGTDPYVSAQVDTAPMSGITQFGSIISDSSILQGGNLSAVTGNGAFFGSAAVGYNNYAGNVRGVDGSTFTAAAFTAPSVTGSISMTNTTLTAGDVSSVDVTRGLALDGAAGLNNHSNNTDDYASVYATIHQGSVLVPNGGQTTGSVIIGSSQLPSSNISAFQQTGGALVTSAAGEANRSDSVRSVEKTTVLTPN